MGSLQLNEWWHMKHSSWEVGKGQLTHANQQQAERYLMYLTAWRNQKQQIKAWLRPEEVTDSTTVILKITFADWRTLKIEASHKIRFFPHAFEVFFNYTSDNYLGYQNAYESWLLTRTPLCQKNGHMAITAMTLIYQLA